MIKGRYVDGFEGEFDEFVLFERCLKLVRGKVKEDFVWKFVNGILEVNDYKFVYGSNLLEELRMFWLEERRNEG